MRRIVLVLLIFATVAETILPLGGWAFLRGAKFTRGIPDPTIQTGDQIRGLTQKILTAKNNLAVLSVRRVAKFNSY